MGQASSQALICGHINLHLTIGLRQLRLRICLSLRPVLLLFLLVMLPGCQG